MKDFYEDIIELGKSLIKPNDHGFQEIVKNYEKSIDDFDNYLLNLKNQPKEIARLRVILMGLAFKMHKIIKKYEKEGDI